MPRAHQRLAGWADVPSTTASRNFLPGISNIPTSTMNSILFLLANILTLTISIFSTILNLITYTTRILTRLILTTITVAKYILSPLFLALLTISMPLMGVTIFTAALLEPDISLPDAVRAVREILGTCWSECIRRSYPGLVGNTTVPITPMARILSLLESEEEPQPLPDMDTNPGRYEENTEGRTMRRLWRERHISEYPASELGGGQKQAGARVPELRTKSRLAVEWTPPGKSRV